MKHGISPTTDRRALVAGQCRNGVPVTRGCLPIEHAGRWVAPVPQCCDDEVEWSMRLSDSADEEQI